jgi:hypothetical protein
MSGQFDRMDDYYLDKDEYEQVGDDKENIHMCSEVYLVISISCFNCNMFSVALFDHDPTDAEKDVVKYDIGGMNCIRNIVVKMKTDGKPVSGALS